MAEITKHIRVLKTTKVGVDFYQTGTVFAPGTPQHKAFNENDVKSGLIELIDFVPKDANSDPVYTSNVDAATLKTEVVRRGKKTGDDA